MDEVRLRQASSADAGQIGDCVAAAYRHYIPRIGKPPAPMLIDYASIIGEHQVWVAELAGEVVGVLVMIPEEGCLLLENVAVHPNVQSQGIGRQLLGLGGREASRQAFPEMRLYTNVLMTENLQLYRGLGWEETGRSVQDGFERVFFRRDVPNQ